jgi:membrane protease YdiL (CAAX protease family)
MTLTDPTPTDKPQTLRRVFYGPSELRAGWRLLIFVAIVAAFFIPVNLIARHFIAGGPQAIKELTWKILVIADSTTFLIVMIATFVMSKIEGRKMGVYGLPLRSAFGRNFWLGVVWGFSAITLLLGILWLCHDFDFGTFALRGPQLLQYAFLWGVSFVLVGLSEEYMIRGYGQFTLTLGIGFWPAAILWSLFFAFQHSSNSGEAWLGLAQVALIALFFCFTLNRTGTLWFAVGFHAAWDWGQTFFYGTPDSGLLGRGHLLNSSSHGSTWMTGGSVGPEGSVLSVVLILLLTVLFHFAFKKGEPYPDPTALKEKPEEPALFPIRTMA